MLVGSAFHKGILYLFQLAWECRFRLPLLITVGFMVLDVRMQLEINIDVDQRNAGEDEYESDEEFTPSVSDTDEFSTSEGSVGTLDVLDALDYALDTLNHDDEPAVIQSKG